ncbi:MAG: hypothetical protein IK137_04390 [Bacilli bacterium]|nr:hypothetical protein [Bacilli bacterium]
MAKSGFDITKEIKNHEKRYTAILVILFIFGIMFAGYCILSIDNKELATTKKTVNYRYSSLSSSYQLITLTDKNKLSDKEGLKSNKVSIHIENTTDEKYEYKVLLKKDKITTKTCGCEKNIEDYKYVKYSLNGKDILKLDKEMVIYKGSLKKDESKDILVNIWIDETLSIKDYHYHGYFSIEKINQD